MIEILTKKTMLNIRKLFGTVMVIFLVAILTTSCFPERKLARQFIAKPDKGRIFLLMPDFAFKFNLKAFEIENAETLDPITLDSLLFERSLFLRYIDDSILLERFSNQMINQLQKLNYTVYTAGDTEQFFESQQPGYIVNLAQVQLDEDIESVFDIFPDYTHYIGEDVWLNRITLSFWFEVSGVNRPDFPKNVLYADMMIADGFDGRLRYLPISGEYRFFYSIDSLMLSDIYTLASEAGKRYAGFMNDYLMERYIEDGLKSAGEVRRLEPFSYDVHQRQLRRAGDRRFIIME